MKFTKSFIVKISSYNINSTKGILSILGLLYHLYCLGRVETQSVINELIKASGIM